MAKLTVNIGASPNSRDGDSLRSAFQKINSNFNELYEIVASIDDSRDLIETNLKGSVYANDGTMMLNGATGKLTPEAVPWHVAITYTFRANFTIDGTLRNIENLPAGWSWKLIGNEVQIKHNTGRQPIMVSYWGYDKNENNYKLRFPTAGYQVKVKYDAGFLFTLNLNTAVTGASNGEHTLVVVQFQ